MIKKEDVKFLYKRYYVPSYIGIDAVTILKLNNDYEAYVKVVIIHIISHLLICTKQKMKHYKEKEHGVCINNFWHGIEN